MVRKVILAILAVTLVLLVWKWDLVLEFLRKDAKSINSSEVKILLRTDPSPEELAQFLFEKGIVKNEDVILDCIKKNDLNTDFSGGKYIVLAGTRITDLIKGFQKDVNGQGRDEVKVKVVIGRCRDIEDLARQVSLCIASDSSSLVNFIYSDSVLNNYDFTKAQIPALFFPGEYEMYFDYSPAQFVEFMAVEFRAFWTSDRKAKIRKIGLSAPSQVSTVGSIVYSEQGKVADEWPTIAALYLNRIKKGMRLQSDPTFKFCWGDQLNGVQRLRANHRNIDCPYNTYKIDGLPPGPICLVPKEVLEAVLNPSQVDYLFMCAQTNFSGRHDFTASDVQHVRNAKKYQQWLSKNSVE